MEVLLYIKSKSKIELITKSLISVISEVESIKFKEEHIKIYFDKKFNDLVFIDLEITEDVIGLINQFINEKKKVIVWGTINHKDFFFKLIGRNINGFFCDCMDSKEIKNALKYIIDGNYYFHPHISTLLYDKFLNNFNYNKEIIRPKNLLTKREWEVLELITKGYTNNQISKQMYITEKTVKNHVSSILGKLSVPDRTNAIIKALKNRWVII